MTCGRMGVRPLVHWRSIIAFHSLRERWARASHSRDSWYLHPLRIMGTAACRSAVTPRVTG
ncbi:hypothetical protein D3C72_2427410 [compost metagenome]